MLILIFVLFFQILKENWNEFKLSNQKIEFVKADLIY